MTIPFALKWISSLLVLLTSVKLSNQLYLRSSTPIPSSASNELVSASYGILVVQNQASEADSREELEDYFIVHYNQENIAHLKTDLKFYPLIDLLESNDICYHSTSTSDQFRDSVLVVKYETVLRCNISSQARDVEQRGGRGLLVQLPRDVRVSDVQVGQHSTIDPFFLIALLSEKTTDSILRRRHHHHQNLSANDSSIISVAIFAPTTLDSTSIIPFDLKTLAVWTAAVITLILGSYFSGKRDYVNVKKKFPCCVDQMENNSRSRSRRKNSTATAEETWTRDSQPDVAAEHQHDADVDDDDAAAGDREGRNAEALGDPNKSILHVIFLVSCLAVLPFVLFIFFNFIAYFMVGIFATASIIILYVCCDSSENQKNAPTDKSSSSVHSRKTRHHGEGKSGENDAEQITSGSTSTSSNSASTITSLSVAKKLLFNHRQQRPCRGSLVRTNAVVSESPSTSMTGIRRGRFRQGNTSGSSETGSVEEESLYYYNPHRSHDSSSSISAVQHHQHQQHRYNLLHEPVAKYNDRKQMLPSRSYESAMTCGPRIQQSSSATAVGPDVRRPLHRSSSILKQSHYQNSSFETSEGQSDTTTSRSLSRQTTFSSRDPDQEISIARPFLKSGFLEAAFMFDESNQKLTITVVQVSEICINTRSLPANVVVRLALLPHKKQKVKTRVRVCSDETCVKFGESFSFSKIDAEDIASMGCRFRLYSCELLRRQSLIGETVLSFAACKPLASETKIMLTLEQKSRFSRCSSRASEISAITRSDSAESTQSVQRASSELLLGLSYNSTTGHMQASAIKGSNLCTASTRMPDSYIKLTLVSSCGNELAKRKSSVRRGNQNPLFKEVFVFQVPLFQLPDVTLVVSVYNKPNMKRKELIGWFSLGHNSSGEKEISHWNEMRDNQKEQVCRWHLLHNS